MPDKDTDELKAEMTRRALAMRSTGKPAPATRYGKVTDPHMAEALDEIRARYSRGQPHQVPRQSADGLPYVPPPAMFQVDPFVVGDRQMANDVKQLTDLDPATKQSVRQVSAAPTNDVLDTIWESDLQAHQYPGLNLLGSYNLKSGDVYVNPHGSERFATIAHEIGHGSGMEEPAAGEIDAVIRRAMADRLKSDVEAHRKRTAEKRR